MTQPAAPSANPLEDELIPWGPIARVGAVSLALFVAFGCMLPIFPLWAEQKLGTLTNVGLVTTFAAGVGLVLGRPIAARMMEGRHRKPTIIVGTVVCSVMSGLYPFLDDFTIILAVRVGQGIGFGMVTTAGISAITDLAPASRRGQVLGYYAASNALSLIIGPALGGVVAAYWNYDVAFFMSALLGLLPVVLVFGLREPAKPIMHGRQRMLAALAVPRLKPLISAHFFAVLVHGAVLTFLPVLLKGNPGWVTAEWFFVIDGVVLIAFRIAVGKRFDAAGRGPFIIGGLVFLILGPLALGLGGSDTFYVIGAVCYGLGFGAYVPASNALVGDIVPATHRVRGFAVFLLAFDLAMAGGGVVFGLVADGAGVPIAIAAAALAPATALIIHAWTRPFTDPGDDSLAHGPQRS